MHRRDNHVIGLGGLGNQRRLVPPNRAVTRPTIAADQRPGRRAARGGQPQRPGTSGKAMTAAVKPRRRNHRRRLCLRHVV